MRLRRQIIIKLIIAIFILFAFYMVVLSIIFEKYYKPDVLGHFKEDLEQVHAFRTSNMTVSLADRFDSFLTITYDNVAKTANLLRTSYQEDFYSETQTLFSFSEKDEQKRICTRGVSKQDKSIILNYLPLWDNFMNFRLGQNKNLQMYQIVILFKGQGLCALFNDSVDSEMIFDQLDKLDIASFTNTVFDGTTESKLFRAENDLLG